LIIRYGSRKKRCFKEETMANWQRRWLVITLNVHMLVVEVWLAVEWLAEGTCSAVPGKWLVGLC
jgi:hypothetical protein